MPEEGFPEGGCRKGLPGRGPPGRGCRRAGVGGVQAGSRPPARAGERAARHSPARKTRLRPGAGGVSKLEKGGGKGPRPISVHAAWSHLGASPASPFLLPGEPRALHSPCCRARPCPARRPPRAEAHRRASSRGQPRPPARLRALGPAPFPAGSLAALAHWLERPRPPAAATGQLRACARERVGPAVGAGGSRRLRRARPRGLTWSCVTCAPQRGRRGRERGKGRLLGGG